jgi:hypothetical protein
MANAFDSRLPKTTTYWREGEIFVIKHTNFFVTLEEGTAIAELLMYGLQDPSTKAMLINNREAKGAWPAELNELWSNADQSIDLPVKKTATLTNSAITTMQINRISKNGGMEEWSKGFNCDFNDEVREYLLG